MPVLVLIQILGLAQEISNLLWKYLFVNILICFGFQSVWLHLVKGKKKKETLQEASHSKAAQEQATITPPQATTSHHKSPKKKGQGISNFNFI